VNPVCSGGKQTERNNNDYIIDFLAQLVAPGQGSLVYKYTTEVKLSVANSQFDLKSEISADVNIRGLGECNYALQVSWLNTFSFICLDKICAHLYRSFVMSELLKFKMKINEMFNEQLLLNVNSKVLPFVSNGMMALFLLLKPINQLKLIMLTSSKVFSVLFKFIRLFQPMVLTL